MRRQPNSYAPRYPFQERIQLENGVRFLAYKASWFFGKSPALASALRSLMQRSLESHETSERAQQFVCHAGHKRSYTCERMSLLGMRLVKQKLGPYPRTDWMLQYICIPWLPTLPYDPSMVEAGCVLSKYQRNLARCAACFCRQTPGASSWLCSLSA